MSWTATKAGPRATRATQLRQLFDRLSCVKFGFDTLCHEEDIYKKPLGRARPEMRIRYLKKAQE